MGVFSSDFLKSIFCLYLLTIIFILQFKSEKFRCRHSWNGIAIIITALNVIKRRCRRAWWGRKKRVWNSWKRFRISLFYYDYLDYNYIGRICDLLRKRHIPYSIFFFFRYMKRSSIVNWVSLSLVVPSLLDLSFLNFPLSLKFLFLVRTSFPHQLLRRWTLDHFCLFDFKYVE